MGTGVLGEATNTGAGLGFGVRGIANGTNAIGVYGVNTLVTLLATYGVMGESNASAGRGVYGLAARTTGTNSGVYGLSKSNTGRGVYGLADAATGNTIGVFGESLSPTGYGLSGLNAASTGDAIAINAETKSTAGISIRARAPLGATAISAIISNDLGSANNNLGEAINASVLGANNTRTALRVTNTSSLGYAMKVDGSAKFSGTTEISNLYVNLSPSSPIQKYASLMVGGNPNQNYFFPGSAKMERNSFVAQAFSLDGGEKTTSLSGYFSNDLAVNGTIWAFFGILQMGSDARIKKILGKTEGKGDLETIKKIDITDYTFIDQVTEKNAGIQKKVIAQQLEKVYPQAVSISKVPTPIPDIYTLANKIEMVDGAWQLSMPVETDLRVGDTLKLLSSNKEFTGRVVKVLNKSDFQVDVFGKERIGKDDLESLPDEIFVFGRYVRDFRTVDYDALAMLNISATQQLIKNVEENSRKISRLELQLEQLVKSKKGSIKR